MDFKTFFLVKHILLFPEKYNLYTAYLKASYIYSENYNKLVEIIMYFRKNGKELTNLNEKIIKKTNLYRKTNDLRKNWRKND